MPLSSHKLDALSRPASLILTNIARMRPGVIHLLSAILMSHSASTPRQTATKIEEAIHSNELVEQSTEEGYIGALLDKLRQDEDPIMSLSL